MKMTIAAIALAAPSAFGQLQINWHTVDGGGGVSSAGGFTLHGTIGQHDAGNSLSAGGFTLEGGFWSVGGSAPCVADVDDGSGTGTPDGGVTIVDLLYYLVLFDSGDIRADVDDGSGTGTPDGGVTIDDLLYFLVRFDAGC